MDKFLETYNLPIMNQEEIENLNRPITSNKIELVIKNSQQTKVQDQISPQCEFYQTFKEVLTVILLKLFPKFEGEAMFQTPSMSLLFCESNTLISKPEKDTTIKENYRPISLMNIDAKKILKKILANQLANHLTKQTKKIKILIVSIEKKHFMKFNIHL